MDNERRQKLLKIGRWIGIEAAHHLIEIGFCEAPASTRYHGCYAGGLFDHSVSVMNSLVLMSNRFSLKWERRRSPYIVAIMHDLCKVDQYKKIEDPTDERMYEFVQTEIEGHGSKSVLYAKRIIDLTPEEEFCIRWHMGAFGDSNEQRGYSEAVKQYQNVLWTHTADMLASHGNGV